MDVHKLDRIFKPQRIAVFGVSENPKSVGSTILRNVVGTGFRGVVYPVHRTLEAALGIPCYPDARSLPRTPDLAMIASAAAEVPGQSGLKRRGSWQPPAASAGGGRRRAGRSRARARAGAGRARS